jgi:hypothetical protein
MINWFILTLIMHLNFINYIIKIIYKKFILENNLYIYLTFEVFINLSRNLYNLLFKNY